MRPRTGASARRPCGNGVHLMAASHVTLVTNWLRSIEVSVKLVTLGDSPHARRIANVGRGS